MDTGDETGAVITSVMDSVPSQEPTSIPYGVKLNDKNFTLWSQIVSMFVSSRGKNGYLTGATKQPTEDSDPTPTAKDIWDAVKHRYYEGADKSILYDLSRKAMETKQAGRPVATFFSDLTIIWQELDYRKPITFNQADIIKIRKAEIDEERVYLFLAGLDDSYDSVRGEILRSTPLPGPEMVFSIVRREEQRRSTMINQVVSPQIAMTVNKFGNFSQRFSLQNTGGKCTCCGNGKHTVENCFKKNGYPGWWNTRSKTEKGKGKADICSTEMTTSTTATPIVDELPSIIDHHVPKELGNIGLALIVANSNKDHSWILDYGATNHMTFEASILKDVCPPDCSTVYNANGVPYPVTGAGRDLSNGKIIGCGCKPSDLNCETCILAKSHRTTYPDSFNRRLVPCALVHSDVWGPCRITSNSGFRWFVLFVDDCTRMTWIYLMRNKSDVAGYFQEHGLIHETTCPSTPQQNGVAERNNRQLLEITRACLIGANMRPHFWEESITNAVYLLNRVPTSVLKFQTPLDKLASFVAIPSQLKLPPRVFGCVVYVHIKKHLRCKLDPCALMCVFVGYHPFQKGYMCYHPLSYKFYVSMDVTFSEHEKFYSTYDPSSPLQGENNIEDLNWINLFPTNC
ncbi:uncharacterized protein LOC113315633 [Papaver somniferum]|uniref:uncharacterized protein LOC113315633 n=1 Tax=Papaver somniferum TaxID=3469 RepID=UPI000E6FBECD|nr:uncharacterized protein LOC113315633 [Papaver somniferum]